MRCSPKNSKVDVLFLTQFKRNACTETGTCLLCNLPELLLNQALTLPDRSDV